MQSRNSGHALYALIAYSCVRCTYSVQGIYWCRTWRFRVYITPLTDKMIFQLCKEHMAVVQSNEPPAKRTRRLKACWSDPSRLTGQHFPEKLRPIGVHNTADPRRKCKICSAKTSVFCVACNVALCTDANQIYLTCWDLNRKTSL